MQSKIQRLIHALKHSVFERPSALAPEFKQSIHKKLRAEVYSGVSETCISPALDLYAEKIARNAYKVVDQDIENLKGEGFSEPEIFELTIAASWSAGLARFEKGVELLNSLPS